jgi:hypothetical protein
MYSAHCITTQAFLIDEIAWRDFVISGATEPYGYPLRANRGHRIRLWRSL